MTSVIPQTQTHQARLTPSPTPTSPKININEPCIAVVYELAQAYLVHENAKASLNTCEFQFKDTPPDTLVKLEEVLQDTLNHAYNNECLLVTKNTEIEKIKYNITQIQQYFLKKIHLFCGKETQKIGKAISNIKKAEESLNSNIEKIKYKINELESNAKRNKEDNNKLNNTKEKIKQQEDAVEKTEAKEQLTKKTLLDKEINLKKNNNYQKFYKETWTTIFIFTLIYIPFATCFINIRNKHSKTIHDAHSLLKILARLISSGLKKTSQTVWMQHDGALHNISAPFQNTLNTFQNTHRGLSLILSSTKGFYVHKNTKKNLNLLCLSSNNTITTIQEKLSNKSTDISWRVYKALGMPKLDLEKYFCKNATETLHPSIQKRAIEAIKNLDSTDFSITLIAISFLLVLHLAHIKTRRLIENHKESENETKKNLEELKKNLGTELKELQAMQTQLNNISNKIKNQKPDSEIENDKKKLSSTLIRYGKTLEAKQIKHKELEENRNLFILNQPHIEKLLEQVIKQEIHNDVLLQAIDNFPTEDNNHKIATKDLLGKLQEELQKKLETENAVGTLITLKESLNTKQQTQAAQLTAEKNQHETAHQLEKYCIEESIKKEEQKIDNLTKYLNSLMPIELQNTQVKNKANYLHQFFNKTLPNNHRNNEDNTITLILKQEAIEKVLERHVNFKTQELMHRIRSGNMQIEHGTTQTLPVKKSSAYFHEAIVLKCLEDIYNTLSQETLTRLSQKPQKKKPNERVMIIAHNQTVGPASAQWNKESQEAQQTPAPNATEVSYSIKAKKVTLHHLTPVFYQESQQPTV